jgi:hypothetical protein
VRIAFAVSGLLVGLTAVSAAQDVCEPGPNSNEAQVFARMAVPLAFGPAQAPEALRPGLVRLALEVAYLPDIPDDIATPTICRPNKPPENVNLLDAMPRPRVQIAFGGGWVAEGSWVPPITVNDVKANLFGLSLARVFGVGPEGAALALRGHATLGTIKGPFTCPEEELSNPENPDCLGGENPSEDTYTPTTFGVEAEYGLSAASGRLRPYAGVGYNRLEPRFDVGFTYAGGAVDSTEVKVGLNRVTVFGGLTWMPSGQFAASAEVYSAPEDVATIRVLGRYALGGED